jgi:hypothetical protein
VSGRRPDGFLWICLRGGVGRLDGSRFVVEDTDDHGRICASVENGSIVVAFAIGERR